MHKYRCFDGKEHEFTVGNTLQIDEEASGRLGMSNRNQLLGYEQLTVETETKVDSS